MYVLYGHIYTYSGFSLFLGRMFCKVTVNIELVNTETFLLGKIVYVHTHAHTSFT